MSRAIALRETWLVQAFQHGEHDCCEAAVAFATEDEAMEYARGWAGDVPYDNDTEHESVVFKAVATFRGKVSVTRHDVRGGGE